ncbi:MAG: ATP-binding cassette domain-containing protein [Thermoflavifilum sp.]|uniref:ABC transporter ATP-binding protein n=1 Tax=Thermoflavifilum sp. TaxID=1968839 RepID=UPI0018A4CD31|nr:ATP-binding cassette domain-containing protein [Thermoflavifilum sp.]QOR75231.1 MAG: ATP-binding cassette domain-containing protein [Thermoflavifilum sp.]
MIEIKQLYKAYRHRQVLHCIDMTIKKAGIYAILGPNGSGKTTLLKICMGLVLPDNGDVYINHESVRASNQYRKLVSYLPQIARFPDNLKVQELLRLTELLRGKAQRKEAIIEMFGLAPYLQQSFRNLSGGTQQKVNLTTCLMYDAPLFLLDEPTAALDPVSQLRLKEFLLKEKQRGKIIVLTTHVPHLVQTVADEIYFLLSGKIHFHGTVDQLVDAYQASDIEEAIAKLLMHQQEKIKV